ncbi:MAG: hypothetical protein EHM35_21220, partial [Planctomycetaceae bacterium]
MHEKGRHPVAVLWTSLIAVALGVSLVCSVPLRASEGIRDQGSGISRLTPDTQSLTPETPQGVTTNQAVQRLDLTPALFVENQGQWTDRAVRYVHDGNPVDVALRESGILFQVGTRPLQFSASFVGAKTVCPVGLQRSHAVFNYCLGNQAGWRTGVTSYEEVVYPGLYEGIDLHVWGLRSRLKYEFHVAPGADYRRIAVRYEGIEGLSIREDGSLAVNLREQQDVIRDDAPYIYQEIDGRKVELAGQFVL